MTDEKQEVQEIIKPRVLVPPPEANKRMKDNNSKRLTGNPLVNFFKIFFGDGF